MSGNLLLAPAARPLANQTLSNESQLRLPTRASTVNSCLTHYLLPGFKGGE